MAFAVRDAGYPATVWYPGALFLLGLAGVSIISGTGFSTTSRAGLASIIFLGGLTAWTYISIAWSGVKGDAWDGANRGLLYFAVYLLFVCPRWRAGSAAALLAAYSFAVTVIGLVEIVAASRSAEPDSYFLVARFSEPTGYQNANCALFSIAFWPAFILGSRRGLPVLVRALLLAAAAMLAELALLSQSRAWLAAMPIVFLIYLAVVPSRVRSLAYAVVVGLAVVAARGPLLDVFPALHSGEGISSAVRSARDTIFISGLALLLVGGAIAAVDRYLWPEGAAARRLTRAGAALFVLIAVTGCVWGLVWLGSPATRAKTAWHEFKGKPPAQASASYFTLGFGSNRYDIWRVALREVSGKPLIGVGSDNFAVDYLRERKSDEEPLYPHSLELRVVAQTGVVGGLLFAGFLVSGLVAWARRPRTGSALETAVQGAGLAGFTYWLVHGSVDWFWELPGLAAPAFALLGLALSTSDEPPLTAGPGARLSSRLAVGAAVVAMVAAAASLVPPWLAAKEVKAATHEWRHDPADAFDRLARARRLNPLSDQPDVIAGAIASRLGKTDRMADAFRRALERNPRNWYAHLELAVAYARERHRGEALSELAVASALDPREPTIKLVTGKLRRGEKISTAALDRIFLRRIEVSNRANR